MTLPFREFTWERKRKVEATICTHPQQKAFRRILVKSILLQEMLRHTLSTCEQFVKAAKTLAHMNEGCSRCVVRMKSDACSSSKENEFAVSTVQYEVLHL